MKRCLNCRQTYEDSMESCPHCGYKPRTKTVTTRRAATRRLDRPGAVTADLPDLSQQKNSVHQFSKKRNIYAASNHSGAFYIKSGERLNKRYSVINVMGFGAFGVAYECFDNFTKQHVVVKEYMPSYLVTRSANGRDAEPISEEAEIRFSIGCDSFVDENTKLSLNNIECVPTLIETFKQNNTAYAVTELVGGESLSSVLTRKGKLSYETTAGIITSVLQGLRRLNRLGIIHGDICPENIIVVSENKTYLLDYNLSDFNKNMYTQRESGKPRPSYSALELYYKNMEVGPWTDVYAAAAVMYKMLTGIALPTAVKRNSGDTLTPVSRLGVNVSAGAEKAMMKALRIDYEKRTQSPEDFLNGFVGDGFDNITAVKGKRNPSLPKTTSRPAGKSRDGSGFLKGIMVILTLAVIAVVIWFFITGVFPMPKAVNDLLSKATGGRFDSSEVSSSDLDSSSDRESDLFGDVSSQDESDSESSGGKLDDIVGNLASGLKSGITDGINSFLDEHIPSGSNESREASSEEYYEESSETYTPPEDYDYDDGNNEYYYDENGYYDDYGNYYEYDNEDDGEPGDNNDDYNVSEEILDDPQAAIEDYIGDAANMISSLLGG